jgi:hypothetical protein
MINEVSLMRKLKSLKQNLLLLKKEAKNNDFDEFTDPKAYFVAIDDCINMLNREFNYEMRGETFIKAEEKQRKLRLKQCQERIRKCKRNITLYMEQFDKVESELEYL